MMRPELMPVEKSDLVNGSGGMRRRRRRRTRSGLSKNRPFLVGLGSVSFAVLSTVTASPFPFPGLSLLGKRFRGEDQLWGLSAAGECDKVIRVKIRWRSVHSIFRPHGGVGFLTLSGGNTDDDADTDADTDTNDSTRGKRTGAGITPEHETHEGTADISSNDRDTDDTASTTTTTTTTSNSSFESTGETQNVEIEPPPSLSTSDVTYDPDKFTEASLRRINRSRNAMRNLISCRSGIIGDDEEKNRESVELRDLITQRADEYVDNLVDLLQSKTAHNADDAGRRGKTGRPHHPNKLLHFLAPKIPAVRHSPDYLLRIRSATADLDAGIAACVIGTIATVTEMYDKFCSRTNAGPFKDGSREDDDDDHHHHRTIPDYKHFTSAAEDIVSDRRFEQLVECLLCGVNVKKRKNEAILLERQIVAKSATGTTTTRAGESEKSLKGGSVSTAEDGKGLQSDTKSTNPSDEEVAEGHKPSPSRDVEEEKEEQEARITEGVSVTDACRAAWGLAVLGAHTLPEIGGENPRDIITALSLRSRELLVARLHLLRCGHETTADISSGMEGDREWNFDDEADELAEDVASAMWAFACVKGCTGIGSDYLFDTCCSILCQSEDGLYTTNRDAADDVEDVEIDDMLERLAMSDQNTGEDLEIEKTNGGEQSGLLPQIEISTAKSPSEKVDEVAKKGSREESAGVMSGNVDVTNGDIESGNHSNHRKQDSPDLLLDRLSPRQLTNILWALALHGSNDDGSKMENENLSLSVKAETLRTATSRRLFSLLKADLNRICNIKPEQFENPISTHGDKMKKNEFDHTAAEVGEDVQHGHGEGDTLSETAPVTQTPVEGTERSLDQSDGDSLPSSRNTSSDSSRGIHETGSNSRRKGVECEKVEVVDAAALLASASDSSMTVEKEILITPNPNTHDAGIDIAEKVHVGPTERVRKKKAETAPRVAAVGAIPTLESAATDREDAFTSDDVTIGTKMDNAELSKREKGVETVGSLRSKSETVYENRTPGSTETLRDDEGEELQVVDAVALLAAEHAAGNIAEQVPTVGRSVRDMHSSAVEFKHEISDVAGSDTEMSAGAKVEINNKDEARVTRNASNLTYDVANVEIRSQDDAWATSVPMGDATKQHLSLIQDDVCLSASDLSSLAWALTELRDPSCKEIVPLVMNLMRRMGRAAMKDLEGVDLANLAWAIARNTDRALASPGENSDKSSDALVLSTWIAEYASVRLGGPEQRDVKDDSSSASSTVSHFEPPELSRLMWSLSYVLSCHYDSFHGEFKDDGAFNTLALYALEAAATNLPLFSSEDLARLAWAFLEICDVSRLSLQTLEKLGQVQATIEGSLLRWESGQHIASKERSQDKVSESVRFTPLFGQSRFSLPFLDHRVGDYDDEESMNVSPDSSKSTLPALRDLTVDPATLCKVAFTFCELGPNHPNIRGAGVLLRIATRLLTSKNGQLMKECKTEDIVRLCYACAKALASSGNEINGEDREFILRHFLRRVVQLLNDSYEDSGGKDYRTPSLFDDLPPSDLVALLWSLGELGVRFEEGNDHSRHAHRKLYLIMKKPWLSTEQLKTLSESSLAMLLESVITMGDISSDPSQLCNILSELESKIKTLSSGVFCEVASSLLKLRRSLEAAGPDMNLNVQQDRSLETESGKGDRLIAPQLTQSETRDSPTKISEKVEPLVTAMEENEAAADIVIESLLKEDGSQGMFNELRLQCNHILSELANEASRKTSRLRSQELRKLVQIYAIMPFQADCMVDAIAKEVSTRLSAMEISSSKSITDDVLSLVRDAAGSAMEAAATISKFSPDGKASTKSFTDGIKAFFDRGFSSQEDDALESQNESESALVDLAERVNQAAASACKAAARIERIEKGALLDAETAFRSVEEGAAFELGRCRELIASYRRMDFETGKRKSRYDKIRRKGIEKRILSRLIQ